jgi:hypothetical protein
MNAKMRIGHFTKMQPTRLRVKLVGLKTILAAAIVALTAAQSLADGLQSHDTNLERWAKQRLAERIGNMRDSYEANEDLRMVTELDVKRGPLPLSAERRNDPIWMMANLQYGVAVESNGPVFVAVAAPKAEAVDTPYPPRQTYVSSMVLAKN